jgi:hypothetical protein
MIVNALIFLTTGAFNNNHPKMLKFLQAANITWSDSTATSVFENCPVMHSVYRFVMVVRKNVLEYIITLVIYLIQTNFGFIVCYDIDNVHIEVISIQKLLTLIVENWVEIMVLTLKK